MQGLKRRIVHGLSFEVIALALAIPVMALIFDDGVMHIGIMTVVMSLLAMGWNMAFNKLFERWEARQSDPHRTLRRRVIHAVCFEVGLTAITLPLIAWWLQVGWLEALVTDMGLLAFFLVYGLVFNWAFDRIFGLPMLDH